MLGILVLSVLLSSSPAPAGEPESLALVVASNRGASGRQPLQYADDDGTKYAHVFAAIAGLENTFLLTELDRDTARLFPELVSKIRPPTRAEIRKVQDELGRRAASLRKSGRPVRFYFVYAGHGDVDQGRGFLELPDGPFNSDDLQALLRAVDANEAHVVLDSCNSYFVVNPRKPGGRRVRTPAEVAENLARSVPNVGVFLSSAAEGEVFEWSELQSGVFSHAVRSGLLGAADADGDGRVTYQELAAFVDGAVADIRNPLYRPKVFARGPNGEDTRAILEVPRSARAVLLVDDPERVRLALRDAEGLRWLDAHKESGATLRVWFPPGRGGGVVAQRLRIDATGTLEPVAAYAVPERAPDPLRLAALAMVSPAIASRGPGEIFRSLFTRPYGPAAFQAFVGTGGMARMQELPAGPASLAANEPEPGATLAPAPGHWTGWSFALRMGAASPSIRAPYPQNPSFGPATSLALSAGIELTRWFATELEAGWFKSSSSPWPFLYPGELYVNRPPPDAVLTAQVVPVTVNLRFAIPTRVVRPYLTLGLGMAFESVEAMVTYHPTLRDHGWVPAAQVGMGVVADLPAGLFSGVDFRGFAASTLSAFDRHVDVKAGFATLFLGWRT